ncbi:MAG TPA: nucleotide exchange factor GrpE [Verrucomicrobiae bacterium]
MSKAATKDATAQPPSSEGKPPADTPLPETAAPTEAVAPAPPVTLSTQEYEELRSRAGKADEHWDRLVRTTADFDNFRKRAAREKQDAIRYANESLISKLLPVLDSLEAALSAAQKAEDPAAVALAQGVGLVQQQFKAALAEAGLEEVDATGQVFDPNWHEAISQQDSADVPEGQVLQQLRKGYKLRDRLLRPATVVVAKHPAPAA